MFIPSVSWAQDYAPFLACFNTLENHSDNSGATQTSDNFKSQDSSPDLIMLYGNRNGTLGIYAFEGQSSWFIPIPSYREGDARIGNQRIVSYRWVHGNEVAFPQALFTEAASGHRQPIGLIKGDADSSPTPTIVQPGQGGVVTLASDDASARAAFLNELKKLVDTVGSNYQTVAGVFGGGPQASPNGGPLKDGYDAALNACGAIPQLVSSVTAQRAVLNTPIDQFAPHDATFGGGDVVDPGIPEAAPTH